MQEEKVKIVVYVPETHGDVVRKALAEAGAGKIGNYSHCSFTVKGIGRFLPLKTAKPAIGELGKLEEVVEERIETVCFKNELEKVIAAVKQVHPYEEPVIDVYNVM